MADKRKSKGTVITTQQIKSLNGFINRLEKGIERGVVNLPSGLMIEAAECASIIGSLMDSSGAE